MYFLDGSCRQKLHGEKKGASERPYARPFSFVLSAAMSVVALPVGVRACAHVRARARARARADAVLCVYETLHFRLHMCKVHAICMPCMRRLHAHSPKPKAFVLVALELG